MTQYRPTLKDIVSEMASDLGSKIGTASKGVYSSLKAKPTSAVQSIPTSTERPPYFYSRIIGCEIMATSLSLKEFVKGFVHDGLETLVFPYMVASEHRLPTLEWAQNWRDEVWKNPSPDHVRTTSDFGSGYSVKRPDTKQYGGIFGTLTGLVLTVVEGAVYYSEAIKGYPNILVLALPLATNAAAALYEYGASINQKLIQRHSQKS